MAQSKRKALGGAVPVATLGQGGSCRPSRGRKRDPVATSSEARDGKPVQLALFDPPVYLGPVRKHPLYGVWRNMNSRCYNPKARSFKNYGLRGIVVCDEWRNSSRAFISWALSNGWRPGLQLDRRDNDGPYSPGNCRFVTCRVNNLNRRNTIRLPDGRPALLEAERNGISDGTLRRRVFDGWTPEQAARIAPLRWCRPLRFADGRLAWPQAQSNGVLRSTFDDRLYRGWTLEQAAGIAPPPQRRQNGGTKQLQTKVRKAK